MSFEVIGAIQNIEVIATGSGIRDLKRLRKKHGEGRWRKLKGTTYVRLEDGTIRKAEIHWYEAHGVGRRGIKIKRLFD
ncbi:MAG: hypothetical protein OEX18_14540 [Candidatus Krumholzibacteria bacterium]|nr:hypothetical protein [Candidatus Krumholzibacteria bacterium]MDH4338487.1 hypothetical protein [Candidatus Krumholzibacteria bacterium]MDH5271203.1 hypothetical protein [Candidatus Krumholzibacteria bacterium]MDH5628016.1 hypothetical protein [Candidatus Krumholzibacteria bacterium]